jgi:hypothetical protein
LLRTSIKFNLVGPAVVLFGALVLLCVFLRALSFWYLLGLLLFGYGVVPVSVALAFLGVTIWQWRRNWISGVSMLCAPLLVTILGAFPQPVSSPIGWAANVARVFYYRNELQKSYLDARGHGESIPVGQLYLDGFGSLTSGLAYDPSGEISLPVNKRSKAWTSGPGRTELGLENLNVHHIVGSYYHWFHD